MATTAIAILNYNGKDYLKKFIPTLIQNSKGTPIFIGDNASTDESVSFIKSEFPEINLVELKENYGYSKGYNLLLKDIEADYIAILNSDIEVTPNWLQPLMSELDKHVDIAAVQPKIKSFNRRDYFEYAGAAGGFVDTYGYPYCRGRLFDSVEKDIGQYEDAMTIKWASGACFLVRKSAFEKVGGFDDDFFAHMEEIDLCWRMGNENYKVKYTPLSTVFHVGGGTLAYKSPFKTFLNFRNGLFLLLKNIPRNKLQQKIVIRVLLDWVSAVFFLLKGKWPLSKAIFKAHLEVYKSKAYFISKRKTSINPNQFTSNFSIVWKYYVKGKRKYNQL
jgi:GT2 family glycosyltransferase